MLEGFIPVDIKRHLLNEVQNQMLRCASFASFWFYCKKGQHRECLLRVVPLFLCEIIIAEE